MATGKSNESGLNIIQQFRLLHQMMRIAGVHSFQLPNNRNDSLKTTHKDIFFGIAVIVILWALCLYNSIINVQLDLTESLIVNTTFSVVLIMIAVHSALLFVTNIWNRHTIWLILCECYDFDEEITKLTSTTSHAYNKPSIANAVFGVTLTVTVMANGVGFFCVFYYMAVPWLFLLMGVYYTWCSFAYTASFIYFVHVIHQRYEHLNQLIGSLSSVGNTANHRRQADFICSVARQNIRLYTIVKYINQCYGVQIMIEMCGFFVYSIVVVYYLYRVLNQSNEKRFLLHFAGHFFWGLCYNALVYCILLAGTKLTKEARYTSAIINKALGCCKQKIVRGALMQFLQQSYHMIPITSCGLFPLDWTVAYSMITAGITYLIILIQFDHIVRVAEKKILQRTQGWHD